MDARDTLAEWKMKRNVQSVCPAAEMTASSNSVFVRKGNSTIVRKM